MSFLIDTCALSELAAPRPSRRVTDWFETAPQEALFISALTLGEIRKGVETLPDGRRRSRIAAWLETRLPAWLKDRVLAVDTDVADEWGPVGSAIFHCFRGSVWRLPKRRGPGRQGWRRAATPPSTACR